MRLKNDFFRIVQNDDSYNENRIEIVLNPNHDIFKSHFPGNPIVPGVCQIQIITELMEMLLGKKLYLSEVKNIKYISVLVPNDKEIIEVSFNKISKDEDSVRVFVAVSFNNKVYSKLSLEYLYSRI